MSPTTKLLVAALAVNVIANVESFELAPSETSAEVMAIERGQVEAPPSLIVQLSFEMILALAVEAAEQPV